MEKNVYFARMSGKFWTFSSEKIWKNVDFETESLDFLTWQTCSSPGITLITNQKAQRQHYFLRDFSPYYGLQKFIVKFIQVLNLTKVEAAYQKLPLQYLKINLNLEIYHLLVHWASWILSLMAEKCLFKRENWNVIQ